MLSSSRNGWLPALLQPIKPIKDLNNKLVSGRFNNIPTHSSNLSNLSNFFCKKLGLKKTRLAANFRDFIEINKKNCRVILFYSNFWWEWRDLFLFFWEIKNKFLARPLLSNHPSCHWSITALQVLIISLVLDYRITRRVTYSINKGIATIAFHHNHHNTSTATTASFNFSRGVGIRVGLVDSWTWS